MQIAAAKNEFEAFQVVVYGGPGGRSNVSIVSPTLTLQGGSATIPASEVRIYREHTVNFSQRSNQEGASGRWRDGLIPYVDDGPAMTASGFAETTSVGEQRNAFVNTIPANENTVFWVDIHVPAAQAPGTYAGTLLVREGSTQIASLPVTLVVRPFSLPSTSSLPTQFGLATDSVCRAHDDVYVDSNGNRSCPSDSAARKWNKLYARFMLDHRITISLHDSANPTNLENQKNTYNSAYGALINGTLTGRLSNATITTLRFPWFAKGNKNTGAWVNENDKPAFTQKLGAWIAFMKSTTHGARSFDWFSRTFHYGRPDEPNDPAVRRCENWGLVANQAAWAHELDPAMPTLVTGAIANGKACVTDIETKVDIFNPLVTRMDVKVNSVGYWENTTPGSRRAQYDNFLLLGPQKKLWMYQSCESHNCAAEDASDANNYPSFMVDATGVQNRSEPWMHYIYEARGGMLYYEIAHRIEQAWTDNGLFDAEFQGQGDGTLVYAGTPAAIGGTTHIPVASIRLKLLREGLEDYEYLLQCDAVNRPLAQSIASGLFPNMYSTNNYNNSAGPGPAAFAGNLESARQQLADCIAPPRTLTLSRAGTGAGTVTSSPAGISCGADCAEAYKAGTSVTLTAAATAGSTFTSWSGACAGSAPACTVTMDVAKSVTATFTASAFYALTVSRSGDGSGSVASAPAGINCGTDCSETYAGGTAVTLTATPVSGSRFNGWSGACSGTNTSCTTTMTAARSVNASFTKSSYSMVVIKNGGGTGTVTSSPAGINCGAYDCSEAFAYGTVVTLTAAPSAGSLFLGWSGGGCSGTATACTTTVTSAKYINVTFQPENPQLTVKRTGWGYGEVTSSPAGLSCQSWSNTCAGAFPYGTSVTLTASTMGSFGGWAGGLCSGSQPTCTFTLNSNMQTEAQFPGSSYWENGMSFNEPVGEINEIKIRQTPEGYRLLAVASPQGVRVFMEDEMNGWVQQGETLEGFLGLAFEIDANRQPVVARLVDTPNGRYIRVSRLVGQFGTTATWEDVGNGENPPGGPAVGISTALMFGEEGQIIVAWSDGYWHSLVSEFNGSEWNNLGSGLNGGTPSLAWDPYYGAPLAAVLPQGGGLSSYRWESSQMAWTLDDSIPSTEQFAYPSLAVAPDGSRYIAYAIASSNEDEYTLWVHNAQHLVNGVPAPLNVNLHQACDATNGKAPELRIDPFGRPTVAWLETFGTQCADPRGERAYVARFGNGFGGSTGWTVLSDLPAGAAPSVSVSADALNFAVPGEDGSTIQVRLRQD